MRAEHADMLLLVNLLHLGKFREAAQQGFSHATLHAPDSYMHPCKCDRDAHEQQHEAARPHTRQINDCAKGNRQDEAAEPADHADEASPVSYTHLRAHETPEHLVCRL